MSTNPYAPPNATVVDAQTDEIEYAGFWRRVGAAVIDTLIIMLVSYPVLIALYGMAYFGEKRGFIAGPTDFIISWVGPAIMSIAFWLSKQATPGKMALSAKVVDARTGDTISVRQSIGRYLGYFVSMLPLGLGIFWVAFDARKQGWHDKLAGTVVIHDKR